MDGRQWMVAAAKLRRNPTKPLRITAASTPPVEEQLSKLDRIRHGRSIFHEQFREFSRSTKATPPRSVQIKSISSPTEGAVVILEGAVER